MTERDLFMAALQIEDPAGRSAYLDTACGGDAELRRRVEALLAAFGRAGSFLQQPAAAATSDVPPAGPSLNSAPAEGPGAVIGPYKLLQQIGEGGMGTVFMAEQTHPVQRKVALKVIKPGMDSRQVIARFEAERQALAMMDHVNIARVFDAGATESGRPYFVMELVHGVPITKYCDDNHLTPRERLGLFVPVCQAIQHAHQKGIIHRDVKPSNVMITLYDGKPVPKVIDFGVAKAIEQKLTERTLFTQYGTMVGTLEYMSPEQAEMSALGVDTRSDIFSLGVLLYELLSGSTPLTHKRLKEAAYGEILRMIKEEEPPRPSTRLSDSGEALASISAQRHMEPAKLTKLVRGELDWIAMKALEKDRNRRYETANGLGADVQRYLADETVQACPPSAWYRCRKFVRRHKVGMAIAGLILFFIVLLGGGGGWVLRDRALRRARTATDVERALHEAQALQEQQKWLEALAVVKHAQTLLGNGGDEELRGWMHERVADIEMAMAVEDLRLRRTDLNDAGFDCEQAEAAYAKSFRDYGIDVEGLDPKGAGALLRKRSIPFQLAVALDDWALLMRYQDKNAWRDRVAVARAADPEPFRDRLREAVANDDLRALEELASTDRIAELPAPTLALFARSLEGPTALRRTETLLRQAQYRHPGDFWINYELAAFLRRSLPNPSEDTVRFYTAALALRPDDPAAHSSLGAALRQIGKLDEAIAEQREAIRLKKDFAAAHSNLGVGLQEKGRIDEAILECQEAIRLRKDYAEAHNNLGVSLSAKGRLEEAIAEYQEAIRLKENYPHAHNNLGHAFEKASRFREAITEYREAIRLKKDYAKAHCNLGGALGITGPFDEAIAECREAIRLKPDYAEAHEHLGGALEAANRLDEAVAAYQEAIRLKNDYAIAHGNLGGALRKKGRLDDALIEFRKATDLAPELAEAHVNLAVGLADKGLLDEAINEFQEAVRLKPNVGEMRSQLGMALSRKGRLDEAVAAMEKGVSLAPNSLETLNTLAWLLVACPDVKFRDPGRAVTLAGKAVKMYPGDGGSWNTLGVAQYYAGDLKAGIAALNESIRLRQGGDANDWFFLAMAHYKLGSKKVARDWFDRAVKWQEKYPKDEELRRFRAEAEDVLKIQMKAIPK